MGRALKTKRLGVWMNGVLVGSWSIRPAGTHEFRYAAAWLNFPDARPISLSMPLTPEDDPYTGAVVEAYFENLLPDSVDIRHRIQRRFAIKSGSAFDLLAEIGRDCVGAIQLLPEDEEPSGIRTIEAEPLDEAGVAKALRNAVASPLLGQAGGDDFRISIAGAQEKSAFLFHEGRWCRPLGSTPTTHIFKLPLGSIGAMQADMSDSVENEWLCSRLIEALGIPIVHSEIASFEDQKVLVIERFDRRLAAAGSWWIRLPQEDLCQATGTHPGAKYESEGGPGIANIMKILLGSRDAFTDRRTFLKAQILFWILAASDGHAKNFSLFIEPQGRYVLTPLYDVISAYPVLGHGKSQLAPEKLRMAMAVTGKNRHYEWSRIEARHWISTATLCGAQPEVKGIFAELIEGIPKAIQTVSAMLPDRFPESIANSIFEGVAATAARLKGGL